MGVNAQQQPQQITSPSPSDDNPTNKMNNNNNNVMMNNKMHMRNTLNASYKQTSIAQFYRGVNVFLTGGTGFVGKAVIEKLLRTCDGLGAIYVLIRAKRSLNAGQRLQELLQNPVFDKIKEKDETLLSKIIAIEGDVSLPQLGISAADRQTLIDNAHVVFHSAATVRFTESLRSAIILNTLGSKRMLELAMEFKCLKSYVHVSTAYSNCDKRKVDEMVYAPPADPYHMISCAETLGDEAMAQLERCLLEAHPNTYTLTKAMAETIVQEHAEKLPLAIVRPSVVTNAWKEPLEGWIDHSTGVTGIMLELGRGGVQVIYGDYDNAMDVVPVDFVANTLIATAWHTVAKRANTMRIYNCTSGYLNKVTWGDFSNMTVDAGRRFPSKYISWYPQVIYTKSRLWFYCVVFFMQRAPAILADFMLMCQRRKPIMYNFAKKVERNVKIGEFFVGTSFAFDNQNLNELQTDVQAAVDGEDFHTDMSPGKLDWQKYIDMCMLGIRRSVLKEDPSGLPHARRRLNGYYWLKKILQLISIYVMLKMTVW